MSVGEVAGKDCAIKVSGVGIAFIGEATTNVGGDNKTYQITDTVKQVLDMNEQIHVLVKGTNDAAEALTTTTNLKMTAHGLQTGDIIVNTSRANAKREVIYVDANNVTVTAVTGQTTADVIEVYKQPVASTYSLNRLGGKVVFTTAVARTVLISGLYLPMSTAAYANKMSRSEECDIVECTPFQVPSKKRVAGLLSASGVLEHFDITDALYESALTAGTPIVIEDRSTSADLPNRVWALLEGTEVSAAIEGVQNAKVSWISHDAWIKLGN